MELYYDRLYERLWITVWRLHIGVTLPWLTVELVKWGSNIIYKDRKAYYKRRFVVIDGVVYFKDTMKPVND